MPILVPNFRAVAVALAASLAAGPAAAHPGHLAEAAGHAHWIALAALLGAAALAAWLAKATGEEAEDEAEEEPEAEEARA